MPPIVMAFFILVGVGTTYEPLIGERRILRKVDPEVGVRTSRGAQEYRVWVTNASHPPKRGCAGTIFALSTRRAARLRVDGVEQLLDKSWRFDWKMNADDYEVQDFEFLDPIGGADITCRRTRIRCNYETGARSTVGLCQDKLSEKLDVGPPRLEVIAPRFVNYTYRQTTAGWLGDMDLRITVRIVGEITEEWWCPEVDVEWPDETHSKKYSDCDPWTGSEEQRRERFSWTFSHRLIPGENKILVRLLHNRRAFEAVQVTVMVL